MTRTYFFAKRVGFFWQVWSAYEGGRKHAALGTTEWEALYIDFLTYWGANKTAQAMQEAFDNGAHAARMSSSGRVETSWPTKQSECAKL